MTKISGTMPPSLKTSQETGAPKKEKDDEGERGGRRPKLKHVRLVRGPKRGVGGRGGMG